MVVWFREMGFHEFIHKCLVLHDVRRRDVGIVNEVVGLVRVMRSKPIRLIPYVGAGKRCRFNVGNESGWQ